MKNHEWEALKAHHTLDNISVHMRALTNDLPKVKNELRRVRNQRIIKGIIAASLVIAGAILIYISLS